MEAAVRRVSGGKEGQLMNLPYSGLVPAKGLADTIGKSNPL
jgi:hypothetical protein